MNKIFFCLFLSVLLLNGTLFAAPVHKVSLKKSTGSGFKVTSKTMSGFSAVNSIGTVGLTNRNTPDGEFTALDIEGFSKRHGDAGSPHLPVFTRLIEIPHGASVKTVLRNYDTEIILLSRQGFDGKLMPEQPSLSKNTPENQRKFRYKVEAYKDDAYNTDDIIRFEKLGILRGVSIGKLTISPLRYNPGRNSLMVFNNIRFDLEYKNGDVDLTKEMKKKYLSPVFKAATTSVEMLPDSESSVKASTENNDNWPLTYVIVADASFRGAKLDEFIQWKKMKGFNVITAYTDDADFNTSSTTKLRNSIKAYLQGLYDSLSPQSYVLLIGDVETIPAWPGEADSDDPHVTDLYYCTYDDSDYLPDAFYGRFPADTVTDLGVMVDKTIQYEKYAFAAGVDESYLDNYMFVAGLDSDYQVSHANAQIKYATSDYFETTYKYLAPDYTGVSNLVETIKGNFNAGMGFVNYTGHCSETEWQNELSNRDVDDLSENDMFGLVIGNCCLSNKFDYDDCLGETLMKKNRSGAVGYIGASNNSYWDEDFYWAVGKPSLSLSDSNASFHTYANTETGVYDGLFHTGMTADQWYITAGQIIQRGNLSVSESASSDAKYYWEIYHLMGDPSLIPFLEKPTAFSEVPAVSAISTCETTACTVIQLEENAYVGLSQNGILIDSAYSGSGTSVNMDFPAIDSTDDLTLIVTRQNRQPYIKTDIKISAGASAPNADFNFTDTAVYSGDSVLFNNRSHGCDNEYNWTFGLSGVANSEDKNPDVVFNKIGTFDVKLVVSNTHSVDDSEVVSPIDIRPKIEPDFYDTILSVDGTAVIAFTELSTNHGDITSWDWSFSGGTAAVSSGSAVVTYTIPGLYTAVLTVIKGGIEYVSETKNIRIRDKAPVASFTVSKMTAIAGEQIEFANTSEGTAITLFWYFDGGTPKTSTKSKPVVVFETDGDKRVSLTVENGSGTHAANKIMTILPGASEPADPFVPATNGGGGGSCFIGQVID